MESTPLTSCLGLIAELMDVAIHENNEAEGAATRAPPPPPPERAFELDAVVAAGGEATPDDPASHSDHDDGDPAAAAEDEEEEEAVLLLLFCLRCWRRSAFRYSSFCNSRASFSSCSICAVLKSITAEDAAADDPLSVVADVTGTAVSASKDAATSATAAALLCSNARAAELGIVLLIVLLTLLACNWYFLGKILYSTILVIEEGCEFLRYPGISSSEF